MNLSSETPCRLELSAFPPDSPDHSLSWSVSVWRLLVVLLPVAILTMIQSRFLPLIPATIIGCVLTATVSLFCVRGLCGRLGDQHRIVSMARKLPFSQYLLPRTA